MNTPHSLSLGVPWSGRQEIPSEGLSHRANMRPNVQPPRPAIRPLKNRRRRSRTRQGVQCRGRDEEVPRFSRRGWDAERAVPGERTDERFFDGLLYPDTVLPKTRLHAIDRLCRCAIVLSLLSIASPIVARADEFPTVASDGLFVGARLEPGGALLLGYDLDIYLTGDRVVSLGPAATFSFLGEDGAEQGRRQDWLLTIDFLRLKVGIGGGESRLRPYLSIGGGMTHAAYPAQSSGPIEVVLADGSSVTGERRYGADEEFGGQISAGGGLDFYLVSNLALAVAVQGHLRLHERSRLPLFWTELMLGLRFGL